MKEKDFWKLIGEQSEQSEIENNLLTLKLSELCVADIIKYRSIYENKEQMLELKKHELYKEIDKLELWCSDDGFEYFIRWLISKGKKTYEAVLENPGELSYYLRDEIEFAPGNEEFSYVWSEAFELKKKNFLEGKDDSDKLLLIMYADNDIYEVRSLLKN